MFVQFQSFPQVGRGENNKKTCETTIQTPKKTHPKTTCSRWWFQMHQIERRILNSQTPMPRPSVPPAQSESHGVIWDVPGSVFATRPNRLFCQKGLVFPTRCFSNSKNIQKQENTPVFDCLFFFWRQHIAVIKKRSHWSPVTHLLYKDKWRLSKRQIRFLKFASDMWHVGMPWYFNNFQCSYDFPRFEISNVDMDSSVFLAPLSVMPSIEVYHDNTANMWSNNSVAQYITPQNHNSNDWNVIDLLY